MTARGVSGKQVDALWFHRTEAGSGLVLTPRADVHLEIPFSTHCLYLSGGETQLRYESIEQRTDGTVECRTEWTHDARFALHDRWQSPEPGRIRLDRKLLAGGAGATDDGFQLHFRVTLPGSTGSGWRFFAPAQLYSLPGELGDGPAIRTYMEDRLAYPLTMAYDPDTGHAIALLRAIPASSTRPPERPAKEVRYRQQTEVGSLGVSLAAEGVAALDAFWPYFEGETSVALNADLSPASAFFPLDGNHLEISVAYELYAFEAANFGEAVLLAFKHAHSLAAPEPVTLSFSLPDSIAYRSTSLQRTYREWDGGAGFFFSFDPTQGYDSAPSGFGTSFNTIPSGDYHRILEYGFTGRQLNAAWFLARRYAGDWVERGRRVVDHFVRSCTSPSGWLFSLYDVQARRPLYSFGGSQPALLHYGGQSEQQGNFLRLMVESALDLLLNCRLAGSRGEPVPQWWAACRAFGDFLVRHQNEDGSWYRAYTPTGERVRGDRWFGADEPSARSATAIPVAYLVELSKDTDSEAYLDSARRAAEYLLTHQVSADRYEGATLDNPNVVDKEAALYAMDALLAVFHQTGDPAHLAGAARAGGMAITWTYLWDPPFFPGSVLHDLRFRATGWGGINSIWGGGVVDIYTLFHLRNFVRLSALTGDPIFRDVARLAAFGTQQLLSYPGDLLGFVDIGMQPEGVGITGQGMDENLIKKGDTWGSLGWIYSAGTFGLDEYLSAVGSEPTSRQT